MKVYILIDDYTPDAGSTIYGVYATESQAETYRDEGMAEDYGEEYAADSNADVVEFTVETD